MKKTFENWAYHDYTTKLSVSIVYALIASVALNFLFKWYYWSSSDFDDFVKITDRIRSTGINNFVFTEYTFVCIGVVKNREEVYNFHFYHSHFDLPLYPYFTGNSPIYRSNHLCVVWGGCDGTRYWASVEKRPIIGRSRYREYHDS